MAWSPQICCEGHGSDCLPPARMCCFWCPEVDHPAHPPGIMCVLPFPVSAKVRSDR